MKETTHGTIMAILFVLVLFALYTVATAPTTITRELASFAGIGLMLSFIGFSTIKTRN